MVSEATLITECPDSEALLPIPFDAAYPDDSVILRYFNQPINLIPGFKSYVPQVLVHNTSGGLSWVDYKFAPAISCWRFNQAVDGFDYGLSDSIFLQKKAIPTFMIAESASSCSIPVTSCDGTTPISVEDDYIERPICEYFESQDGRNTPRYFNLPMDLIPGYNKDWVQLLSHTSVCSGDETETETKAHLIWISLYCMDFMWCISLDGRGVHDYQAKIPVPGGSELGLNIGGPCKDLPINTPIYITGAPPPPPAVTVTPTEIGDGPVPPAVPPGDGGGGFPLPGGGGGGGVPVICPEGWEAVNEYTCCPVGYFLCANPCSDDYGLCIPFGAENDGYCSNRPTSTPTATPNSTYPPTPSPRPSPTPTPTQCIACDTIPDVIQSEDEIYRYFNQPVEQIPGFNDGQHQILSHSIKSDRQQIFYSGGTYVDLCGTEYYEETPYFSSVPCGSSGVGLQWIDPTCVEIIDCITLTGSELLATKRK